MAVVKHVPPAPVAAIRYLLLTLAVAPCMVLGCLPGQVKCGHPHKDKCCGVPNGPAPAPTPVSIKVDPANRTHRINPLFNGCHSDSGEIPCTRAAVCDSAATSAVAAGWADAPALY